MIGELDAIGCHSHPNANPVTGVAHACGHHAQMAAMIGCAIAMADPDVQKCLAGTVNFLAVPAEEYIDADKRARLKKEGIEFCCGKSEMIRTGVFDDTDIALTTHVHMVPVEEDFYLGNPACNGYSAERVTVRGKAAHGAIDPWNGVNALSITTSAIQMMGLMRETFREEDHVRLHNVIRKAGDVINSVPDEAIVETKVRAASLDKICEITDMVNRAYAGSAYAFGGKIEMEKLQGYMPIIPRAADNALIEAADDLGLNYRTVQKGDFNNACTDVGDLSHLVPVVNFTFKGFEGKLHGADFKITDTGKEGSEKYKIDWTYDYSVDSKNAGFAYSCLSELPNHQIGLMYEKYDSYNPAELHSQDIMKYEELSLSELMGKEVVEIIPQTEGKGTVSQRNTVKKGSKITIEAYPEEGYQFVRWEDEKGNPVSEQEKYTFDAKESAAFTAVFEQEKEEVDKSHLKEAIRHAEEQMQDEKYQDVIPVVREEYEEAYKNAKAIDEKPDATSEEVETAYKTLIEVGKRLTMYKGDLTELQAAYDLYAGKDLSIYTQDSKTVLEEALKEAEKVLKLGENAVKEDVNEALEKLQKAIEGLEKSEPNPPTDPEFPTDPDSGNTDIVNPDNSLSPDDTPSTNGTPSASDEKAVATGDKETPVGWTTLGFAAMLAAAGRFLGRKKRR